MITKQNITDELFTAFLNIVDTNVLFNSSVLILGGGGIGSYATDLLARLRIGKICVWDMDKIDLRNLARSIYTSVDWGISKSKILARHIRHINPQIKVLALDGDIQKASKQQLLHLAQIHQVVLIAVDNFQVHEKINSLFYSQVESVYTYVTDEGDSGEIIRTAPEEPGCIRCLTNFEARRQADVARDFQALGIDFFRVAIEAVSVVLGILLRGHKGGELFQDYVNPANHLFMILSRRHGALAEALPPGFLGGTICVETDNSGTQCPVCGNR